MIQLSDVPVYLVNDTEIVPDDACASSRIHQLTGRCISKEDASKGTITHSILESHNRSEDPYLLKLKFDCLASHDLTFVGVVQTAKASGLEAFPIPYILTNCHNSLCAVGGTLNEDDHQFGLSAAQKYGGIYVPPHLAVIHSYMREMHAVCGSMILGSDSHTRYGALGTMAIGEGGGELVKQLLGKTYDLESPEVICIHLTGKPKPGVGPQDVALAIIRAVFNKGYVKNKIMEFTGEGIESLSADFRNGIDVMTTETACLSTIWKTDEVIKNYFTCHGRGDDYKELTPASVAWYSGLVEVNLSQIQPMIALPFHPSNAYTIRELNENLSDILHKTEEEAKSLIKNRNLEFNLSDKIVKGRLQVDQAVVAGCDGGTFENIMYMADVINEKSLGNGPFALSVYPSSQPIMLELLKQGAVEKLIKAGATMRTAFCGPCFGAGDIPANGQLSIRHTTRNFPNREGSKPNDGQIASVALMDARSIAATAINGGILTSAEDLDFNFNAPEYHFDNNIYRNRVYNGYGNPNPNKELICGPNISDWPEIGRLEDNMLLGIASVITDPVTTTDELIPSGDTSTFRSNPIGMAQFTLSRKDPEYVRNAEYYQELERQRKKSEFPDDLKEVMEQLKNKGFHSLTPFNTGLGSLIYATKPGDGSAREQAASCQRVLGGCANIAKEYITKRYRSNLINWGLLPLKLKEKPDFEVGDYIFLPNVRIAIADRYKEIEGFWIGHGSVQKLYFGIGELTEDERNILLAGCLINFNKK